MSDMSVGSNEQRMSTPLSNCTDTMAAPSISSTITSMISKIDANSNDIEKKDMKSTAAAATVTATATNEIANALEKSTEINQSTQPTQIPPMIPTAGPNLNGLSSTDAAYVDEFYRKISEYYRGIFSNIDIKDPNISADVLNYYQLIRQFYEQTMAINIQRNTALGLSALSTDPAKIDTNLLNTMPSPLSNMPNVPTQTVGDVSTIDLTIKNPPTSNDSLIFNNIKTNNTFQNNINIGQTTVDDATKGNLLKLNDGPADDVAENKVTIISAGVSINVSSLNSNSLKISCKTTPPKKRYSAYTEDAPSTERTTPKSMISAPMNLNRKFDVDTVVAAKRKRENGADVDTLLTKSNLATDALRINTNTNANANAFESNKSSPMTNTETSSSITDIIPITSTYLQLMRSMGFSEEDALKFDNLVSFFFFVIWNLLFTEVFFFIFYIEFNDA